MVVFIGGADLIPASRGTDLARVEHARRFKARAAAAGEAGDLSAEQARVSASCCCCGPARPLRARPTVAVSSVNIVILHVVYGP